MDKTSWKQLIIERIGHIQPTDLPSLLETVIDVCSTQLQYKTHVGSVDVEQTQIFLSRRLQQGFGRQTGR